MSSTNTALLVGVGALILIAWSRKASASPAPTGAGANPTSVDTKPKGDGKVTEEDWFNAGVGIANGLLNSWGQGNRVDKGEFGSRSKNIY